MDSWPCSSDRKTIEHTDKETNRQADKLEHTEVERIQKKMNLRNRKTTINKKTVKLVDRNVTQYDQKKIYFEKTLLAKYTPWLVPLEQMVLKDMQWCAQKTSMPRVLHQEVPHFIQEQFYFFTSLRRCQTMSQSVIQWKTTDA